MTSADEMYGPITMLCANNRLIKHIPWSVFKLSDQDWHRVVDAHDILRVGFPCSQFEQKLIDYLGLESNSTVLLGRHPSHPLVRPSRPQRSANGLGEETRCTQV